MRGFGLAVLPFRADAEDRHWGDGLADDLIAALSRFSTLAVLSRASSFGFDPDHDPQRVAAALGVRFVVTGAVRLSPHRGCAFRQRWSKARSGRVLWAERYDRAAADVLDVQDELIEKIVATLVGRIEQTGRRDRDAQAARPGLGSLRSDDARHALCGPTRSGVGSQRDRLLREGAGDHARLSRSDGDARAHAAARLGASPGRRRSRRGRAPRRLAL